MVNLSHLLKDNTVLSDLLKAFQPTEIPDYFFQGMQLIPSPGSVDYLYSGAYIFLGSVFDVGMYFSFYSFFFNIKPKQRKIKMKFFFSTIPFAAINFSFTLASEVLLTLEFMVTSIHTFHNRPQGESGNHTCTKLSKEIVPFLRNKLGSYAQKLLMHKCDRDDVGGSLKSKVSFGSNISNKMYWFGNLTKSKVQEIMIVLIIIAGGNDPKDTPPLFG